ncbi:MAG: hypothetical protein AABX80_02630, partial [Nanoarchaeota archaeon]
MIDKIKIKQNFHFSSFQFTPFELKIKGRGCIFLSYKNFDDKICFSIAGMSNGCSQGSIMGS